MSHRQIDYDGIAELYDHYVTVDDDVPFFLQETASVSGRVLELTAGTGRLSLPLLRAGVRLTCVDVSRRMLDFLSRKLEADSLRAQILCADVCDLQLPAAYELAIFPFQAFMEIVGGKRQRQALAAVATCLVPGGRFICTLHNPAVRRARVDGASRVVGRFPIDDGTLVVSGIEQGGDPVVRRQQLFERFDAGGRLLSSRVLPMEFELIEPERFEALAHAAGFRVIELFGGYDRAPFDAQRSPVMIWVLQVTRAADDAPSQE